MSKIEVNAVEPQCGTTLTLGASGDTVIIPSGATITNNGTQTGFGRTGTVDWDTTPKTANFDAVSGDGFFCNTTSGAFTATLPSGAAGAIVSFADYAGTWQTNNLTVSPQSGEKIGGVAADVTLNTEGQSVTFVYVDSTQGWVNVQDSTSNERGSAFITATGGTITTCGNDKIHTFTSPGTFTVCTAGACTSNNTVSYLVIAGGGAGGGANPNTNTGAAGGGAGGYRELKNPINPFTASPLDGYCTPANRVEVSAQAYPITVGAGGAGVSTNRGGSGSNSVFSTITAAGGGGGGSQGGTTDGANGGSGGGGGPSGGSGGTGNTPPVTPAQGTNGGNFASPSRPGSGGGATGAGTAGSGAARGGTGGAGATSSINGTPTARAGGGGGGAPNPGPGTDGGGNGGTNNNSTAGTANTGGGGGGNSAEAGGPASTGSSGGSGLVIIRYKFQ